MKVKMISVLAILALCFVFLGCPDPEDEFKPALTGGALTWLSDRDIAASDILVPADTNYAGYQDTSGVYGDTLYMKWTDATAAKYQAYFDAWSARAVIDADEVDSVKSKIPGLGAYDTAQIRFYSEAGFIDFAQTVEVVAGTIVLQIYVED